jgi:peptidoglycan L-alanyl-D-glutamate endopeptidase CwlK
MPTFSNTSEERLNTCHPDLVTLFKYVVANFDCSVVHGQRTPDEQFALFKKGRKLENGVWVPIDPIKKKGIVTNCDGIKIKSRHNVMPLSEAADVVPYPTMYSDEDTIRHFAGYVLGVADMLYHFGHIDNRIICGIDWDNDKDLYDQRLFDAVHFQIQK